MCGIGGLVGGLFGSGRDKSGRDKGAERRLADQEVELKAKNVALGKKAASTNLRRLGLLAIGQNNGFQALFDRDEGSGTAGRSTIGG